MARFLVIYERAPGGEWSAHAPDDLGCYAAGASRDEAERLMREAIPIHLQAMREAGQPVPEPVTSAGYVSV